MIQGLTRTSEEYEEAIKCLRERYDRPRFVQEEHIRSNVDAVPVKNGSDKELRRLYDAVTQHYRALKAAKSDSFDTVLTVHNTERNKQLQPLRTAPAFVYSTDLRVRQRLY